MLFLGFGHCEHASHLLPILLPLRLGFRALGLQGIALSGGATYPAKLCVAGQGDHGADLHHHRPGFAVTPGELMQFGLPGLVLVPTDPSEDGASIGARVPPISPQIGYISSGNLVYHS